MEFTVEAHGGVPVVVVTGRVSHASAAALVSALDQAMTSFPDSPGLVLDLKRVDYISSGGLQAIEGAAGRLASVVLVAPPEPVRIVLDLAGLLTRVTIAPTLEAAVARIGANGPAPPAS